MVTQDSVAELMGTGKYFFRDKPELKNIIKKHQVDKKVNDEQQFVLILQEVLKEKVEKGDLISYQGVAKTLLESLPPKETRQSPDQQRWTLTRKLKDNVRCKAIIETEIEKYQQRPSNDQLFNLYIRNITKILKTIVKLLPILDISMLCYEQPPANAIRV